MQNGGAIKDEVRGDVPEDANERERICQHIENAVALFVFVIALDSIAMNI